MSTNSPINLNQLFYKYLLLSLFILPSICVKGQNYLMEDGHSSYHAGVQISRNTFENHYAVLPGYTYKGRLTVGFDLGKTKDVVNKINSTVFRPNISYLILKQSEDGPPASFDINVGYQYNYVSQLTFNTRSVQFGAGLYHQISPLENVKIIPAIFFEGNKATSGPNPLFQESVFFSYGIQASIVWNNFYITPKFILFDGITTLGVKLGMIFESESEN